MIETEVAVFIIALLASSGMITLYRVYKAMKSAQCMLTRANDCLLEIADSVVDSAKVVPHSRGQFLCSRINISIGEYRRKAKRCTK